VSLSSSSVSSLCVRFFFLVFPRESLQFFYQVFDVEIVLLVQHRKLRFHGMTAINLAPRTADSLIPDPVPK